ncbi:MAG TPA: hypothetical protein VNF46_04835 [Gammaproteobacteria bacterium]|nr:hypothetical protein [Gammaproteobacteria bacterium]
MTKLLLLCTIVLSLVAACATDLTEAGSKVRLLASADQASHCQVIKVITAGDNTGSDDAGNATKKALNEAAVAGANAFYIVSTSQDALSGASVVGNALICK